MFARVLLQDAAVILLDEPFTAIDTRTVADLMRLVERWHGEGRTVIAALHDLDQVRRHFPETLLLSREAIAWGPTAEVLTAENLFRARRAAAWDDHADVCEAAPHGHGTQDGGDRRSAA
jgi:zinc/manganese transport system ATP-binding protein